MNRENELQTSAEILDSISDGFLALDRTFNVVYLNKEAEKVFMISKESMIGHNFFAIRPQAIGSPLHENFIRAMGSKSTTTFYHKGILTGKSFEIKVFPSEKGISIYFQDITERRKNEEKIQQLASIVESSSDAIISGKLDGSINGFNSAATATYGYSFEDVNGKPISLLFLNKEDYSLKKFLKLIRQGVPIKNLKSKHLTESGEVLSVLISMFPVKDHSGMIQGFSIIARDITEHQRIEQEIAKLERLNLIAQLAAGVAHEIRNPMTTVKGFLQLRLSKKSVTNEEPYLELMINEIDRANLILTELLSLGKEKTDYISGVNLNRVLKEIQPLLLSDSINSEVQFDLELGSIPEVFINQKEVKQLIFNLFRNGLEAMVPGGRIKISTYQMGGKVVLAVKDEGPGISKDIQKKIGTPFFTTKDKGTGLGLAVCSSIAERNNAIMDYITGSEGTTFFVRFQLT